MDPNPPSQIEKYLSFPAISYNISSNDTSSKFPYDIGITESIMVPICVYLVNHIINDL